jgi:hypothetical protein
MAWHMVCGLPDTGSESFKSCNISHGKRVLFFLLQRVRMLEEWRGPATPGQFTLKESEWAGRSDLYRDEAWMGGPYCLPWQGLPSFSSYWVI